MLWPFAYAEFDPSDDADPLQSVRMRIVMNETIVRMPAYPHQIAETLENLFKPFGSWLCANLGFDVDDALKIVRGLEVRNERVYNQKLGRARNRIDALGAAVAGGSAEGFPPGIFEQLRAIDTPAREATLQHLGETFLAREISGVLAFDAAEIAADSSVDEATVQRFFDAFSINLGDVPNDYVLPSPSLLLKTHPFVRFRDKYVLPSAMLLDTAIQLVLEHLMNPDARTAHAAADKQLWERYSVHRKEYAEARSVELLQKVLPGAQAYRDLKYRFNGREYELDGLILFDRYVIVEEVKAGNFSAQARSGDVDALVGDIRKLIDHPHEQGERALAYIRGEAVPTFRLPDGSRIEIDKQKHVHELLLTVTLEDLGQLTSAYNELPPTKRQETPWAVSLRDLEIIVEHVGTSAEFLHYVQRRVAQKRSDRAVAFDELEWLGRYLVDSLELSELKHVDANHEVAIVGHTVDLGSYYLFKSGVRKTPVECPVHKLPAVLSRVLRDMERSGTLGWTDFAIALLDLPRELQGKFDRDLAGAVARGHSSAFVCRVADRTLEVWAKVGPDTVLTVQPRTDALQIVLEFTTTGTLLQALELGSDKRVAFPTAGSDAAASS